MCLMHVKNDFNNRVWDSGQEKGGLTKRKGASATTYQFSLPWSPHISSYFFTAVHDVYRRHQYYKMTSGLTWICPQLSPTPAAVASHTTASNHLTLVLPLLKFCHQLLWAPFLYLDHTNDSDWCEKFQFFQSFMGRSCEVEQSKAALWKPLHHQIILTTRY